MNDHSYFQNNDKFIKIISFQLYRTSDDYEERCIAFDFLSRNQLLVARDDGHVVRLDDRESSTQADEYKVLERTVKCLSVHPREQHYFITSDNA